MTLNELLNNSGFTGLKYVSYCPLLSIFDKILHPLSCLLLHFCLFDTYIMLIKTNCLGTFLEENLEGLHN